jgi:hypothetical protein
MGMEMTNISSVALALGMIGAFLLTASGIKLTLNSQTRSRGILMIVAAAVIFMNVMIWTV